MAGVNHKKIVFLCSGGGGNLSFIFNSINYGLMGNVEIAAVFTDRKCQANNFADSVGLNNKIIDFNSSNQIHLFNELLELNPDIIITTVHKILQKPIVDKYKNKLINLHYSLLPAFGGLIGGNSVRAAFDYGARVSGVTVHQVDESVDGGKPLVQGVVPLDPVEDDFDRFMNIVFRCGCIALLSSINHLLGQKSKNSTNIVEVVGRVCLFSGVNIIFPPEMLNEVFWSRVSRAKIFESKDGVK